MQPYHTYHDIHWTKQCKAKPKVLIYSFCYSHYLGNRPISNHMHRMASWWLRNADDKKYPLYIVRWLILASYYFLALFDSVSRATAVAQASVIRLLTRVSQKLLHGSRPNFVLLIRHISRLFFFLLLFSNFLIFKFTIFFLFSLTWDPMEVKISKCYFSHSFGPISTKHLW